MKRKILLSIILLSGLLIVFRVCNPPQRELDQIFEFKLGMTTKELMKVTNNTPLEKIEKSSKGDVFRDTYKNELARDRVKAFFLDYYISADKYVVEDIEFSFFDDKLYRMVIRKYNSATEDWLDQKEASILNKKYKKPPEEEKESDFEYGWWKGERRRVSDRSSDIKWSTNNKRIMCSSWLSMNPDYSIIRYRLILENRNASWMAAYGDLSDEEKEERDQKEKEYQKKIDQELLDRL